MAKKSVGILNAILTLDSKQFAKGIDRARRNIDKFALRMTRSAITVGKWGAAIGTAATAAGIALTKRAADAIDVTAKLSDRLNISTESLTAFARASRLAGVDTEQLNKSIEKMQRGIGEAIDGTGEAREAFKKLGLDVKKLSGQDAANALADIADAINRLPTAAEKTAAAMDIFGRSGGSMTNFLSMGGKAIKSMAVETKALGLSFSRIDARKVEEANDALQTVKDAFDGIFTQIAIRVSPVVTDIANRFIRASEAGGGIGEKVKAGVDVALTAIGYVADFIQNVQIGFKALQLAALEFTDALARPVQALEELVNKAAGVFGGSVSTPTKGFREGLSAAMDEKISELKALSTGPSYSERIRSSYNATAMSAQVRSVRAQGGLASVASGGVDPQMVENNKLLRMLVERGLTPVLQ